MLNNSEKSRKRENIEDQISVYLRSYNPVFIINRKGDFTNVNDAFCKKIGVNSDDIIGRNIGDVNFLTEVSQKQARVRNISRLLGKETPFYDIDIITKNGDVSTLHIDTKSFTKQGRIIGEVGIARGAKKIAQYEDKQKQEIIEKNQYDLRQLQKENEKIRSTLELRERELDDVKKEFKNSQLTQEKQFISESEKKSMSEELETKQEDLESIIEDLKSRNKIIEELKKQAIENQNMVLEKNNMILQLQNEIEEKVDSQIKRELQQIRTELDENNIELNNLKIELEENQEEIKTRDNIIEDISQQLKNNLILLTEKTSVAEQLETDSRTKTEQIKNLEQHMPKLKLELDQKQSELETLMGSVEDLTKRLSSREELIKELESELLKLESENEKQNIEPIRNELEKKLQEIEELKADLQSRNQIIGQIKKQLTENHVRLLEKTSLIDALKSERESAVFSFNNIKDSISSSIILIDKDNIITTLNEKAEKLLGSDPNRIIGTNVFDLELMNDERLSNARDRSLKSNKRITERSVTVKNQKGDIHLIDVSQMPLIDGNGESQGSFIVIDDVSNVAGLQAELERKQEDLEALGSRYKEAYKRLSLIDREIEITNEELRQRIIELGQQKKETGELKVDLENNKQQLKIKDETLDLAGIEIEEKTNEINQLKIELENDHNELMEKNDEINRISTELDKRENELESKNKDIGFISEELNDIQGQFLKNQEKLEELQLSLKVQTEELQQKEEEITKFQTELEETQQELDLFKQKFTEKSDENVQFKMRLDKRFEELEVKNEELELIRKQFNDKSELANNLQTEIDELHGEIESKNSELLLKAGEIESKNSELLLKAGEIEEINEELKAGKSAINWFKVEVEDKQKEIELKSEEIESTKLEIGDFAKQLSEQQTLLDEKNKAIEQVQAELQVATEEIKLRAQGIETQKNEIEKQQLTIQDLQIERINRKEELNFRNTKLNSKEQEISELQAELEGKLRDLENSKLETLSQQEIVKKFKQEKDQIIFHFNKMKNTIPWSIIMVDKNNNIINWNKKAEEMIGLDPETATGKNLFDLNLMKKERILEGIRQFEKDKKPVAVKSISVKNKQGDIHLTNILHDPMHDQNGEFLGAIMVLEDISDTEEIKAELRRKDEDLEKLDSKFKEVYTKLKIVDKGKIAVDGQILKVGEEKQREIEHIGSLLGNKHRELESISSSIASKTNELESITKKLEEDKSTLEMVENELARRRVELESPPLTEEELSKTVKEKLKIFDEIDKSISVVEEESLKTKKIGGELETEGE